MEDNNKITTNKTKIKARFSTLWSWVRCHKLPTLFIAFFFWMIVIDDHNYITRIKYYYEIQELKRDIEKYQKEYDESTELLNELESNPERIEKVAREKYFMKKPNEDIYIFED